MSRRTLLNYTYDVLRETKGQGSVQEAVQALQDGANLIDTKGNWEFLTARSSLVTVPPYQTGTISYGADATHVTLSGGVWDVAWKYKEIKLPDRRLPVRVASIDSPTTLTLTDPVPLGAVSGKSYMMIQGRYALPADCEPGRDLIVKGPSGYGVLGWGVIPKYERMRHELKSNEYRVTGPMEWYTDDDVDTTLNIPTIRFWPAPSTVLDLRLTYYRSMRLPASMDGYYDIPLAFERLIVLMAAALIMKRKEMQGWVGKAGEAGQMMNDLYDRHATSAAYDGEPDVDMGDEGNHLTGMDSMLYTR